MTRAGVTRVGGGEQAFEVLSAHPVVPASCTADEKLKSLHLCEAFGAMVCALNHFLRTRPGGGSVNWEWLAHKRYPPLHSKNPPLFRDQLTRFS